MFRTRSKLVFYAGKVTFREKIRGESAARFRKEEKYEHKRTFLYDRCRVRRA